MSTIQITEEDKLRLKQLNLNEFMENTLGLRCKSTCQGKSSYFSPFREETSPSFTVNYYRGEWRWKDWGGDPQSDHGDIISLVMKCYSVEFLEAVRMLLATNFPAEYYRKEAERDELDRVRKLDLLRKIYLRSLKVNDITLIRWYFDERGVSYHYPMGCVCINSFNEKKRYIGIPIPSPWNVRGLEMRELKGTARKTLGEKTFWTLNRDPKRVLITESVLDCLAGEIILSDDTISLWALNGVGNADRVTEYIDAHHPTEVYIALDNDPPGMLARDKLIESVSQRGISIILVEDHVRENVKDLHKLIATPIEKLKKAEGEST